MTKGFDDDLSLPHATEKGHGLRLPLVQLLSNDWLSHTFDYFRAQLAGWRYGS
jgi:hypothetical protein